VAITTKSLVLNVECIIGTLMSLQYSYFERQKKSNDRSLLSYLLAQRYNNADRNGSFVSGSIFEIWFLSTFDETQGDAPVTIHTSTTITQERKVVWVFPSTLSTS
jgi:hypothetical protein